MPRKVIALTWFESLVVVPLLVRLDAVRGALLRRFAFLARPFVRSRDARVVASALMATGLALAGAAFGVGFVLLLGPLLLGTPHLCFEARHLYLQRRHQERLGVTLVVVAQVLSVLLGTAIWTVGPACVAVVALSGPNRTARTWVLLGCGLLASVAAVVGPTWSRFLLLHVHNFAPVVVWLFWRKRPVATSGVVAALVIAAAAFILLGGIDSLPLHTPLSDEAFSLNRIADAVAGQFDGVWRKRLLVFFCFTQSLHYAIWLRLIPEEARAQETPCTWQSSWRDFKRDAGPSLSVLMFVAVLVVPAAAMAVGAVRARAWYVRVSEFHATVEVLLLMAVASTAGARTESPARHRCTCRACSREQSG